MRSRLLLILATLACTGAPATAQSLFNSAGLGLPVEALDGRARALGNLGIGLTGGTISPTDPASMARLRFATGIMAGQPSWVDYTSDAGGASGDFRGNRFPLMGVAYPLLGGMMSIQIGSFLDQHFIAESVESVDLGSGPIDATDTFDQDGSVSNINFGYARMLAPNTAVGVTLGRYAGSLVRTLTRAYGVEETTGVEDYVERGTWSYAGNSVTAGVSTDLPRGLRVAASVQIPSALDATASENTDGANGSFDLPIQYRVGASAPLATGLVMTASAMLADWSSAADGIVGVTRGGNTNGFGVGIELTRARLLGRQAPLRFGFRRTGLPFSFDDETATERIFSGGLGLTLNTTNNIVLAGADIGIERGRRSGAGISEGFWRATISLVVSGL